MAYAGSPDVFTFRCTPYDCGFFKATRITAMTLTLRCECGQVAGTVETRQVYVRATCYCHDCQAYARFLGRPGLTDAEGGTDILAMNPAAVRIASGQEQIACMSLSDKGLLRWYAACCRTPLGNTPRDAKVTYVGICANSLSPAKAVDDALGPANRVVLQAKSAKGPVRTTPVAFLLGGLRIARNIVAARLRKQAPSLFFDAGGQPIRAPEVINAAQRAALDADA